MEDGSWKLQGPLNNLDNNAENLCVCHPELAEGSKKYKFAKQIEKV